MANKPIEILINAKDNASAVFDAINGKLKAVAAAVATYFGIQSFANVVKSAADFETAMSRIQAATGASAAEMAAFRAAAEAAAATSKYSATEAAGALEGLAKAGLSGKEAIAALPAAMALAQAGDISLAASSEHLTSAIFSMGLKFSESARVADVFSKGANESKTSVDGLAQAFSYAAPVAKSLGLSLEGTTAIIGLFASAGIDASRAGTALNNILSQFSDPAGKFREELAAIGITTTDFEKALHQLSDAGVKGEKAIRSVGMEAGPALQAALGRGMPALDELKAKLMSAEGSAAAAAKVMGDNLNGAMGKLSSAWQAVTVALGTPVLPVLKSGVDELATAINAAVTNGTITRFGEALAAAFQSAITWLRAFAAETDFKKTAADMQAFATRAGEVFDQIGQYSTNAGNIVKLAYGVMSAGTNAVLTAVYGIGEAFAGVARDVMLGVALIRERLAKITFGELSESFKEAAEDARSMAQAFGEASVAMRAKAVAAFGDMADSAQTARDGFEGLAAQTAKLGTAAAGIAPAAKAATEAMDALRESAIKEGDAWLAAAEKLEALKKATDEKANSDIAARAWIEQLRNEYHELIASGDLEQAAANLESIAQIQSRLGKESEKSAEQIKASAKEIENAYAQLGVTSTASLKNVAEAARVSYETIKKSGTATAQDLSAAFAAYAEKAIAANGGVASAAIKTEAAMRGYKIEVDETGKASLKLVTATDGLAASFAKAGEAIKAKAAAAKAESDLMISGLELRRSELSSAIAIAKAHGDEEKVTKLTIEQKRIEIQIIQAMVKAQIAEAEAIIAVAEAKKSELSASGNLTPEKRAELDATIKSGQAKINEAKARGESVRVIEDEIKELQKSTNAQRDNASSINQTTAALEKMNREKERGIAAQEKANELKQREIDLYNKKWKMDAEHNSVDDKGNKIEAIFETQQSLFNRAVGEGLPADQAKALADQMAPSPGQMFNYNAFWQAINEQKQKNAIFEVEKQKAQKKIDAGGAGITEADFRAAYGDPQSIFGGSGDEMNPAWRAKWNAYLKSLKDAQEKQNAAAASEKPPQTTTPSQRPPSQSTESPKQSPTSVVNLHYNTKAAGSVTTDPSGADALDSFMRQLEMGQSNWPA